MLAGIKHVNWRKSLLIAALALLTALATGYEIYRKQDMVTAQDFPPLIEVAFGQQGTDWQARYGKTVRANTKNFGLNFYDVDSANHGKSMAASVKTGKLITTIPNTMSVSAAEDRDRKTGINHLYITAEVNRDEYVSHDIARQYILGLIQSLRKTGWMNYHYPSDPRLKGKATLDYYKAGAIDPDYPLSFQEWMSLDAPFTWKFYADHTYLTLQVDRDVNHLDPAKPGAYFISLTFSSREEEERLNVDEKDRDHWRATWLRRALGERTKRNIAEAQLRAQGVPIDTDYKDPPLPPPPPGQQNPILPDSLK